MSDRYLEAIEALDDLDTSDPEHAHGRVDDIMFDLLPESVQAAVQRVYNRTRWWAFS